MPYFTGDKRIDALLESFKPHWKGAGTFDTSATVTFSFAKFPTPTDEPHGGQSFFTNAQKTAARLALKAWSNVADITFTEVTDTGAFAGNGIGRGDINFINETIQDAFTLAYAFFPTGANPRGNQFAGDVHVNVKAPENFDALDPHEQGLFVLMHELGHSIGLGHPSEGAVTLPDGQDNDRFTIMVDNVGKGVFIDAEVFPSTPMLFDILAIQHLYGPNPAFHKSGTTYAFDDEEIVYETIWDAGGKDTISVEGSRFRAIIDLRAGHFSSVVGSPDGNGAAGDNLAIAFGVVIENATGGDKNDVIIGNGAANTLKGGAGIDRLTAANGNDSLFGGAGDDTIEGDSGRDLLNGGPGKDRLIGGKGGDSYVIDSGKDVVVETSGGGTDTLVSTVSRTLPAHIENLTLAGGIGIDGIGNGLDNVILGNKGSNELKGMSGADTLTGGPGHDSLDGGKGGDQMAGSGGDDVLNGADGADILIGGPGGDSLTGGAGGDRLRYERIADGGAGVNGVGGSGAGDAVADFQPGVDGFQFVATAFDPDGDIGLGGLVDGSNFSAIVGPYDGTNAGANANHAAGNATFVFSTADSTLYYDADGVTDGYTVVATLTNAADLTSSDIELI